METGERRQVQMETGIGRDTGTKVGAETEAETGVETGMWMCTLRCAIDPIAKAFRTKHLVPPIQLWPI